MKSHIKIAKVFGVELGLHYSWLIIALLITFSLGGEFYATNPQWGTAVIWAAAIVTGILFFACLFAHELSHALVAKSRGIPIRHITLFLLGGMAQIEGEPTSAGAEFWMAIVGPITSGVIGAILLEIARLLGTAGGEAATPGIAILLWLGYINLALAAFNMIPGFPLDGGRVLRAIVWWISKDARKSTVIAARVGQAVAFLFIVYGIYRLFAGSTVGGIWIAFIGWFLMQAAGASLTQARAGSLLAHLRVRDLMSTDCTPVAPDTRLDQLISQVLRTGTRCFIVVEDSRMLGLVSSHEVQAVPSASWPNTRVGDIMRPAGQVRSVTPDTSAFAALQTMVSQEVNDLPVVDDGRFAGIVSRAQIVQSLQVHNEFSK